MKSKIETDYNWGSWNLLAWKKKADIHDATTGIPSKKDIWETSLEMTYWWFVTTLIWVVLLIGWSNFFFYQLSQKHMLLVIINYCFVSRIPCSFLFLLVPSCSPFPFLFPLFRLFLLVPLVPLVPPFFPLFSFVPLFPFVSLVPLCFPCCPLCPLFPCFPCSFTVYDFECFTTTNLSKWKK